MKAKLANLLFQWAFRLQTGKPYETTAERPCFECKDWQHLNQQILDEMTTLANNAKLTAHYAELVESVACGFAFDQGLYQADTDREFEILWEAQDSSHLPHDIRPQTPE